MLSINTVSSLSTSIVKLDVICNRLLVCHTLHGVTGIYITVSWYMYFSICNAYIDCVGIVIFSYVMLTSY
jgi:hypothetical protein